MNIIQQYELKYITCIVIYKYLASVGINLEWQQFFDKFYKVQNFFPYAIPIVLDNEPPRM